MMNSNEHTHADKRSNDADTMRESTMTRDQGHYGPGGAATKHDDNSKTD